MTARKNIAVINYYLQIYLKTIPHLHSKILLYARWSSRTCVLAWVALHKRWIFNIFKLAQWPHCCSSFPSLFPPSPIPSPQTLIRDDCVTKYLKGSIIIFQITLFHKYYVIIIQLMSLNLCWIKKQLWEMKLNESPLSSFSYILAHMSCAKSQ